MLTAASLALAAVNGVESGLRFNLYVALPTAAIAAAVAGYPRAPRSRVWWAVAIVLAGWAIGDGGDIVRLGVLNPSMFAKQAEPTVHALIQVVAGVGIGYALPTVLGAYVGRLVHKGTGFLSAAAVAIMTAPAFATIGATTASALERLVA